MSVRYLEAERVILPSRAPQFVEEEHCQWCNSELAGRQRLYCSENCPLSFYNSWCSRPAYIRATFIRDNFTCQECGLQPMREDKPWLPDISLLECDHIIPISKVGYTEMENLQTLCQRCNRKKGVSTPSDLEEEYPRVVPSRDKSKCPDCRASGYRVLPWTSPDYYDPLMIKVQCLRCGGISYIAPAIWSGRKRLLPIVLFTAAAANA